MGAIAIFTLMMGLIGAGISAASQQQANESNLQAAEEINQQNIEYSREAAETANEQTRQNYWELYSPQSKVQQYKEAGLNPALMYSMGGISGTGQAAAQGLQPTLNVPYMNPLINGNIMNSITEALSKGEGIEKTQAETKQIVQSIDNLKQQIKESETKIQNLTADTENLKIDKRTKELNNDLLELRKQYEAETIEKQIDIVKKTYEKLDNETKITFEQAVQANIETKRKEEMLQAILDNYNAQTGLYQKQQLLTMAQTLTEGYEQLKLQAEAAKDYALAEEATAMIAKMSAEKEKLQDEDTMIKAKIQITKDGHYFFEQEKGLGKIIGLFADGLYGLQQKMKGFSSWAKQHQGINNTDYHGLAGEYAPTTSPMR